MKSRPPITKNTPKAAIALVSTPGILPFQQSFQHQNKNIYTGQKKEKTEIENELNKIIGYKPVNHTFEPQKNNKSVENMKKGMSKNIYTNMNTNKNTNKLFGESSGVKYDVRTVGVSPCKSKLKGGNLTQNNFDCTTEEEGGKIVEGIMAGFKTLLKPSSGNKCNKGIHNDAQLDNNSIKEIIKLPLNPPTFGSPLFKHKSNV